MQDAICNENRQKFQILSSQQIVNISTSFGLVKLVFNINNIFRYYIFVIVLKKEGSCLCSSRDIAKYPR